MKRQLSLKEMPKNFFQTPRAQKEPMGTSWCLLRASAEHRVKKVDGHESICESLRERDRDRALQRDARNWEWMPQHEMAWQWNQRPEMYFGRWIAVETTLEPSLMVGGLGTLWKKALVRSNEEL